MTATRETLREAVARALCISDGFDGSNWLGYADDADAALAAIEAAGWRVVQARTTTGVTVAPYGDEIVVLLEEDNDIASAILDVNYATELRDGLTEVLAAPRIAEKE